MKVIERIIAAKNWILGVKSVLAIGGIMAMAHFEAWWMASYIYGLTLVGIVFLVTLFLIERIFN